MAGVHRRTEKPFLANIVFKFMGLTFCTVPFQARSKIFPVAMLVGWIQSQKRNLSRHITEQKWALGLRTEQSFATVQATRWIGSHWSASFIDYQLQSMQQHT